MSDETELPLFPEEAGEAPYLTVADVTDLAEGESKAYPVGRIMVAVFLLDGKYYAIDFTLKQLKMLTVNDSVDPKTGKLSYPPRFPLRSSKFHIPTLGEYIELVQGLNKTRKKDIGIYPELKAPEFHTSEGKDIAAIVLKVLEKYDYNRDWSARLI